MGPLPPAVFPKSTDFSWAKTFSTNEQTIRKQGPRVTEGRGLINEVVVMVYKAGAWGVCFEGIKNR